MNDALGDLLERLGDPTPGRPAVVVSAPGVGKTPLLVRLALEAMTEGRRVLHVALGDGVEHVRAHYDEVARAHLGSDDVGLVLERRRMVLSVAEAQLDPTRLAAQVRMLAEAADFPADLLVVDGLHEASWRAHGEALAALTAALTLPAWIGLSLEPLVPVGDVPHAFVLRLSAGNGSTRLVREEGGQVEELPWGLDPATQALVDPASRVRPALKAADVTLYSGGAGGAEAAFGEAAAAAGVREVAFSFDGHRQARTEGRVELSARELEAGDVSLVYVSRRLHREYNQHGLIRRVLQTLWHMVSRAEQVFVVGVIQPDGTVVGGTGWSVELARMWKKDLWVYDQDREGWFRWDGHAWTAGSPKITSPAICGTGTRYLEEHGRAAIEGLFRGSFGG